MVIREVLLAKLARCIRFNCDWLHCVLFYDFGVTDLADSLLGFRYSFNFFSSLSNPLWAIHFAVVGEG